MAKKNGPKKITMLLRDVPFDMMRYDRACPATEQDSAKLERLARRSWESSPLEPQDRQVDFLCYAPGSPTIGRWESFGCKILKTVDVT